MLKNLKRALALFIKAHPFLQRALSGYHYPIMRENLDHLIRDCRNLIAALESDETLPR